MDIASLSTKMCAAQRILISYTIPSENFFDLIDNDKLIAIDVCEMNSILDSGCFSVQEKDYIRELRRRTMNRKTAKLSRIKDKQECSELNEEIDALAEKKKVLSDEKEQLTMQIKYYKDKTTTEST